VSTGDIRSQSIEELASVYDNAEEARALLEDIRFPESLRPNFGAFQAPASSGPPLPGTSIKGSSRVGRDSQSLASPPLAPARPMRSFARP